MRNAVTECVLIGYVERLDLHDKGDSYLKLRSTRGVGVRTTWSDLRLDRRMYHQVPFGRRVCLTVQYDAQHVGYVQRASTDWE